MVQIPVLQIKARVWLLPSFYLSLYRTLPKYLVLGLFDTQSVLCDMLESAQPFLQE